LNNDGRKDSNGLWHGPRATYIFYGIYYFVILLLEVALEPVRNGILKLTRLKEDGCIWRFLLSVKTLTIIFVGELFFNAKTLPAGFKMFASIFRKFNLAGIFDINFLTKLGTKKIIADKADYISIAIGIIVVAIYGALKQRGKIDYEKIDSMKTPYKWAIYYALIILVLLLGAYGDGYDSVALIYANF